MPHNSQCRHILVIETPQDHQIFDLENSTYSIGRHPSNQICLSHKSISRNHATLVKKRDEKTKQDIYEVIDGDLQGNFSYNGIFVNGNKTVSQKLQDGDIINFGCEINAVYHQVIEAYQNPKKAINEQTTLLLNTDNESSTDVADIASEEDEKPKNLAFLLPQEKLLEYFLKCIQEAQTHQNKLAVFMVKLENYQDINDNIKLENHDLILENLSERLRECFRSDDVVASWEDNQFIVLLPQIRALENAVKIQERIIKKLQNALVINQEKISLNIDIGFAIYPDHGQEIKTLLSLANSYLRSQQDISKNFQEFTPFKANIKGSKLAKFATFLKQALEREELILYYQPKYNLKTQKIEGLEALLRWQHSQKGLIYPDQFISLAEQTELTIPLAEWVLKNACKQAQMLKDQGFPPLSMAVNLSPRQFQDSNLLKTILKILDETLIPPHLLELEITEKTLRDNEDLAGQNFQDLVQAGVRLTLDDFGTDYASLVYLKQFSFHNLKIAQTLISDLTDKPEDIALLVAMIAWGKVTNLNIIAEGVETEEQLNILRRLNCDRIQGYQITPPLSAEDTIRFLLLSNRCEDASSLTKMKDEVGTEVDSKMSSFAEFDQAIGG